MLFLFPLLLNSIVCLVSKKTGSDLIWFLNLSDLGTLISISVDKPGHGWKSNKLALTVIYSVHGFWSRVVPVIDVGVIIQYVPTK